MFVTKAQFYIFISCICFGGISGILISIAQYLKIIIKYKWLKTLVDVFAFLLCSGVFILGGYYLEFPSIRVYMLFGFFVGIYCYMKSFHIILAKIIEKVYNNSIRKLGEKIKCLKGNKKG